MSKSNIQDEVAVYTALGHLAGEMIRIFLESQGVPARLSQESAGLVHGLTVGSLGEVEILVPAAREVEARDLLTRMDAGEFELPDGESTEDPGE
jgi:hypothetical protein